MREITRRLYTKPVMLAIAFLVVIVMVVGLFVTTKSTAAMSTYIPAGDDTFETTGNGETYHNFQASKVPADFFGPGSLEYGGTVPLVGVPIPGQGDIDTIIHRNQDVFTPGNTTITMTALSLKSINPITVSYCCGGGPESWNVSVSLSDFKTSGGSMSFSDGGTFDSSLKVWPKFTFTRVSDGATRVLDTGDPDGPGLTAASDTAVAGDFEPVPGPTISRCAELTDFEGSVSAAASTSCAPVTLTSTNSPWPITRPITEQELLASHNASPPGTKKAIAARAVAVDE